MITKVAIIDSLFRTPRRTTPAATEQEVGINNMSISPWGGLYGPVGISTEVVNRVALAMKNVAPRKDVRAEAILALCTKAHTIPTRFFRLIYGLIGCRRVLELEYQRSFHLRLFAQRTALFMPALQYSASQKCSVYHFDPMSHRDLSAALQVPDATNVRRQHYVWLRRV